MNLQCPESEFNSTELIRRARCGDADAFGEVVTFFRRRILSYCWRMVGANAEDAAQEIFIKFYLALDRFDPTKPIRPFLFRIAHNHCVDILKKRRIRAMVRLHRGETEGELQIRDEGPDPEAAARNVELRRAIGQALDKVPVRYRSPLVMWHVEGIAYEEISRILDLPMGTVKARIHRGRKILQQKLAEFVCTDGETP